MINFGLATQKGPIPGDAESGACRPIKKGNADISRIKTLAAALVAVLLYAAGAAGNAAVAETFKLGHTTWVGYGPLFVAKKKGYFKEEGVDVELVNIEDVKVRFAALASGRIDAMATTVDALPLYLKPQGTKYQYLFALDDSKGGDGVVANKDIETIADLKGKKVAFTEGSVSQFYLNVLLKEAGLEQSDIEAVNMTAGEAGSAFVTGRVDAAVTWEPWLTRGKQAPHGRLLTDSSKHPGLITDVVLARAQVVEDRKADIQALYRAWARAVDFVKSDPDEAHRIMAKGLGGWLKKPAVLAKTLSGVVFYDASMNAEFFGTAAQPGELQRTVQQALDIWQGFGKLEVSVTPADLVSYSVLE